MLQIQEIESIKVKDTRINLIPDIQYSKSNRAFRYIGLTRKATEPEKYINGTYKSIWVYRIHYTDNNEQIGFEFGYNDEFVRVVKGEELDKVWKC